MHDSRRSLSGPATPRTLRVAAGIALVVALVLAGCQPISPDLEAGAAQAPAETTEAAAEAPAEEAAAQEAPAMPAPMMAGLPEVTIDLTADGIVVPESVTAGPTLIHVVNSGGQTMEDGSPLMPEVGRFLDGATVEDLLATFPEANENPTEAFKLISIYGGLFGPPAEMAWDLLPGEHVALTTEAPQMTQSFAVVEGEAAAAPAADVLVEMADFSFTMPDKIAAGPHVWELTNVGKQWHEMVVLKLAEGVTVEDLFAFFETAGPEDVPPFDLAFGYAPMSEGNRAWVTVDLPAGEYTVICFLPDLLSDMSPHVAHGMIRTLIVE